ncbi:hypothetical protein N7474_003897 [Penicillium riverlandense]|uniref:uncharacterized protein n=1 Tax=Penicillium riverlandense TaxID=1903569 RepID=UPI0025486028|nr:uncharacterized protein N7474_003897 [Penicillium riverlandense]KAJ5818306.1 hypothetical protein N7474_003897 [Penicillium riverlandense]
MQDLQVSVPVLPRSPSNSVRIRRVKCGEERPSCTRCTSTGRNCEYDRAPSTALQYPLSASSPVQGERHAFEYYFYHAAQGLSDTLDFGFWCGTVLQICRAEPVVWDAIVALSTLYESPTVLSGLYDTPPVQSRLYDAPPMWSRLYGAPPVRSRDLSSHLLSSTVPTQRQQQALTWYSRSIGRLQWQIERGVVDVTVALASCILFICIEILQGNVREALALYKRGLQLARSITTPTSAMIVITSVLQRMGPWALIIGGVPHISGGSCSDDESRTNTPFLSLSEARSRLHAFFPEWKDLDCDWKVARPRQHTGTSTPEGSLHIPQRVLEHRILAWHARFSTMPEVQRYIHTHEPTGHRLLDRRNTHDGIIAGLIMTYTSILILTQTTINYSESIYDAYDSEFMQILRHAPLALAATACDDGHQPPFVFDMGIGMPLLITALKCRSPAVRRQALRLQRQAPQIQSFYLGAMATPVVAAIVAVEEKGPSVNEALVMGLLDQPGCVPPDNQRVLDYCVLPAEVVNGKEPLVLQYTRRESLGDERRIVEERVMLAQDGA